MQVYETPEELWDAVSRRMDAGQPSSHSRTAAADQQPVWYEQAVQYWDKQAPTDDGVLGGYGHVSGIDVRDSKKFLQKAMSGALAEAAEGKRSLIAVGMVFIYLIECTHFSYLFTLFFLSF